MKTKLTIDNLDLQHSVTYEKMSELRGDFDSYIPPIQPLNSPSVAPMLFSRLDQLFGIRQIFRAFSFFQFPKNFGRIRFLFGFSIVPRLNVTNCLSILQKESNDSKDLNSLLECFEEIREKENLLQEITLKIRSCQKS